MPTSCVRVTSLSLRPIATAMLVTAVLVPAMLVPAGSIEAQPVRATAVQLRADVAQLRTMMTDVEKSWTPTTRALAMARIDSLERAVDTISAVAFEVTVARIVASSDNGHSAYGAARRASRFNRVGVRLSPMGTDFIVMRARPADADLLGARVIAIDGRPLAVARDVARTLNGGTDAWRDRFVPFTLESPEQLKALGLANGSDAVTYRFELLDGRTVERRLAGESPDTTRARQGSQRWYFGDPLATDTTQWRVLRGPEQLPWSVREPGIPFRLREAPEADAVVVELRQNTNAPQMPIARFLDSARTMIERVKPRNVILDMRFNGGGDLNTTRNFMRLLPTIVPGRVFVLTSPYTFSAAISSVGYLKQAAPEKVTIVGEEVGDRLEFWAEGGPLTLANTGIMIGFGRERHDYKSGCRAFRDCHGNVVREPIAVPTFTPQIAAPWTREAYLAGRDPGMEAIIAQVARDKRM
jgi:hypothetical protein